MVVPFRLCTLSVSGELYRANDDGGFKMMLAGGSQIQEDGRRNTSVTVEACQVSKQTR